MGQKPNMAHKNSGSHKRERPERRRKTRVHLYLDEEVVGGLREAGYSLSALVNKLLREHLEKVTRMEAIIWRMAGPAGFEPATSGLEGRRPILLGYGPSGENLRGALIKVTVGGNKRREGSHFLLLRRSGTTARPTRNAGPQVLFPLSPLVISTLHLNMLETTFGPSSGFW